MGLPTTGRPIGKKAVVKAFRQLSRTTHSDHGGGDDAQAALAAARDSILGGMKGSGLSIDDCR